MKFFFSGFLATIVVILFAGSAEADFSVQAEVKGAPDGRQLLLVTFKVPSGHYLYADQMEIKADGSVELSPYGIPKAKMKYDEIFAKTLGVYEHDVTFRYMLTVAEGASFRLKVGYQGCTESICFPPESKEFVVDGFNRVIQSEVDSHQKPQLAEGEMLTPEQKDYKVIGREAGYLKPKSFLAFIERTEAGEGIQNNPLAAAFEKKGAWLAVLLILLGGLALNLTPCVLPMIPINIAIIGAGAQASSKGRGFALGATYGLGIGLVYGVLGLAVILTGAKFGALNASPWFNLVISVVFVLLALAMFDVFSIDFSKFQGRIGETGGRRGSFITAFFMGGVAALLAGACVAPVVISVLLVSAEMYAGGNVAGLLLPFLLGLGMALPWPFAGAGLSFLPKPGGWMEKVKYLFGIIIILFALWYGKLGISLIQGNMASSKSAVVEAQALRVKEGWFSSIDDAIIAAKKERKPVFVDFWASWCKNCLKMEKTTFKDPEVEQKLRSYVKVKYRAEDMNEPGTKAVLDQFGVIGLPTYLVLRASEQ